MLPMFFRKLLKMSVSETSSGISKPTLMSFTPEFSAVGSTKAQQEAAANHIRPLERIITHGLAHEIRNDCAADWALNTPEITNVQVSMTRYSKIINPLVKSRFQHASARTLIQYQPDSDCASLNELLAETSSNSRCLPLIWAFNAPSSHRSKMAESAPAAETLP